MDANLLESSAPMIKQRVSKPREHKDDSIIPPVTDSYRLPKLQPVHFEGASLQLKLALIVVPVMLFSFCMLLAIFMTSAADKGYKALAIRAEMIAAVQAQALSQPLWELNKAQIIPLVDTLAQDSDIVGARLLDENGKFVHGFGRLDGGNFLTLTRDIPHPKGQVFSPLGQLSIAISKVSLDKALQRQLLLSGAIITVGALLVSGVIFFSLQRLVFHPLSLIKNAIGRIENHEWPTIHWTSNDQFGRVVSAFNHMVGTLRSSERELREVMHAAQSAIRAKNEFLANISHELRTPLNAILGFSEVLKSEMFGPLASDRYRSYAENVFVSGLHLLEIINDILDLSKIAAGTFELIEQAFDVNHAAAACVQLMQEQAKAEKISLSSEIQADLPQLQGDELRIRQIILNLLSNAIKFTLPGGKVWLKASMGEKGNFELVVGDSGIGMHPQDIPKALSAFGQIENVLSRSHPGTGLGLPLVQAFCEMHQARLMIDSSPGVGTVVSIVFPVNRTLPCKSS